MSIIAWASSWRLEPTNSNFIKERDIKMSGQKKINNNNKKQKKQKKPIQHYQSSQDVYHIPKVDFSLNQA